MEKIEKINIKNVDEENKKLLLEGRDWLEVTGGARKFATKDKKGKDAEITIEDGKITFIRTLGGGSGNGSDGELVDHIKKINWNIGNLALMSKLRLLIDLERLEKKVKLTETQSKVFEWLKKDSDKILKFLGEIKKEQEKND